jgi:alpha-tubulin suppressor-like RCC1 family protein
MRMTLRKRSIAVAVLLPVLLASCGGDDGGSERASAPGREHPLTGAATEAAPGATLPGTAARRQPMALPATGSIDATSLFNWIERTYPELFPKGPQNQALSAEGRNYTLRYYPPPANNYAGVGDDGNVYGLGAFTGNAIQNFGALAGFTCLVEPELCPLSVSIQGADRAAANVITRYLAAEADDIPMTVNWTVDTAAVGSTNPLDRTWTRPGSFNLAVEARSESGRPGGAERNIAVVSQPVAAGTFHTCALTLAGGVSCWGYNVYGQLGNGSRENRNTPTAVEGLSDLKGLAAGYSHTCAITSTDAAKCWGWNDNGQLGDGSFSSRSGPVTVQGLAGVAALSGGAAHTCALLTNGSVACWGANNNRQIDSGDPNNRTLPVPTAGLSGVVAITSGASFNCALKADGSVWCWGSNSFGQLGRGTTSVSESAPAAVSGLTGVVAIAAGENNMCALKSDGSVACWGINGNNQLGNGLSSNSVLAPAPLPGVSEVVAISSGRLSGCVTERGGAVKCWGRNLWGEGGDGGSYSIATPTLVPSLGNLVYLAEGERHACGLRADGSAWCKGDGVDGELGNGLNGSAGGSRTAVAVVGGAAWWRP